VEDEPATIDQLMDSVKAGEPGAFTRLHLATESRVRSTVLRILVDPWQSDEVTQEVFLEVWRKAALFDTGRGSALSWVLTIATRRAIDRVRAVQASRERDVRDAERGADGPRDLVWEAVQARFDQATLLQGLQRITPLQREALTSTYLHGRTISQAAHHLGASESAVKARVSEGIAHLRKVIAAAGEAA
jgi:RNA polymerase sigma-70 factor (ECF subfamily)